MSNRAQSPGTDRFATARGVADAVLYEGYVLYPYRASSRKNQLRWQFGVLAPSAFCARDPSERSTMRTECVLDPGAEPVLDVRIRCLQLQRREVHAAGDDGSWLPVEQLDVEGRLHVTWDEAVEQVVDVAGIALLPLAGAGREVVVDFEGSEQFEPILTSGGAVAGRMLRHRAPVQALVRVAPEWAAGPGALIKLVVTVTNTTPWSPPSETRPRVNRDDVIPHCLVAVHTMFGVDGGRFVSAIDPPADAREAVAACANDGTYPVLIGGDDVMLSSPIILYDHPEVAPESPGDLYDSTEIDEILALRVLTLTEREKAEARGTDTRSAAIIDRVDGMAPEMWERLHGTIRELHPIAAEPDEVPWWDPGNDAAFDPATDELMVNGTLIRQGSHVRLQPSRRADAHDIFLRGLGATVAGIFNDVDGNQYVAVTIDSDPGTAELAWQGRYRYFAPEEIEPLANAPSES